MFIPKLSRATVVVASLGLLLALLLVGTTGTGCGREEPTLSSPVTDEGGSINRAPINCYFAEVFYEDPGWDDPTGENVYVGGVQDFSLIKAGDDIHVFHIADPRNSWNQLNDELPGLGSRNFGHAVWTDMDQWITCDRIQLRDTSSTSWNRSHVWAPHVIEADGEYYMFYTGVEWGEGEPGGLSASDNFQRIGLAKSTDLYNWSNIPGLSTSPGLLLDGPDDDSWCAYGTGSVEYANDCRDPFVFQDIDGKYVMFVTTRSLFNPGGYTTDQVIATATCPNSSGLDDPASWTWDYEANIPGYPGYIAVTQDARTESPTVFYRDGSYYLMMTRGPNHNPHIKAFRSDNTVYVGWTEMDLNTEYYRTDQPGYGGLIGYANETLYINSVFTMYGTIVGDYVLSLRRFFSVDQNPKLYTRMFKFCESGIDIEDPPAGGN
jgi:hypothetical protein